MKSNFPTIKTHRLVLRQITESDLENIYKGLSHPEVIKYYGVSFKSLKATREQMNWYKELEKNQTGLWWAICSKENNTFMGASGLNDLDRNNNKAEIGLWLLPDYWGKGIMKEVIPLICKYGFEELGLHRIEGFVDVENTACKKGLNKLNFMHEGTLRDCEIKDGKYISLDVYSVINKGN